VAPPTSTRAWRRTPGGETSADSASATHATHGAGRTGILLPAGFNVTFNTVQYEELVARTTKIAFLRLNNETQMEFLAGEPNEPSWWRDVYLQKGLEIHHQGYVLPESIDVWATVMNFAESGWGQAVQWGHWGTFGQAGSGCYVYVDSQRSLGVTVELLGGATNCGNLPVSQ
jgi:hypothetical protein